MGTKTIKSAPPMSTTETQVRQIIDEQTGVTDFATSAKLVEDLGLDSLDDVELCMAMEEAFDLEIPDDDWCELRSVQQIIAYLEKQKVSDVG